MKRISGSRLSRPCAQAKHIPVDVLDKLCATLNCQPGDLFEYRPDEDTQ
ncbi:MAG: helix-turn-helix domain-containing protein [Christensenellaceae bacterium]|nr:helix-turn-helix domain-containing protein [Christensenellaceae bacterium]